MLNYVVKESDSLMRLIPHRDHDFVSRFVPSSYMRARSTEKEYMGKSNLIQNKTKAYNSLIELDINKELTRYIVLTCEDIVDYFLFIKLVDSFLKKINYRFNNTLHVKSIEFGETTPDGLSSFRLHANILLIFDKVIPESFTPLLIHDL